MTTHRLPLLALPILALTACSVAPLTVGLKPFSVDFAAVGDTGGRVVYPASPTVFDRPVLNVKTIGISGTATATNILTDMSFTFYGRTVDPSSDPNCIFIASHYLCKAEGETLVSNTLTFGPSSTQQKLGLGGQVLVDGINSGSIWLGARVEGTAAVNSKLEFSNLSATVTLF